MKKLVCMVAVLLTAVAFGGGQEENQSVIFSSNGPDKYMDGTTVLDGEFYVLVWVRTGANVPAFSADAKLLSDSADCKIIAAGPWAHDGRCSDVTLRKGTKVYLSWSWPVLKSQMDEYVSNGSFRLCLLDTRRADNATLAAYEMTEAGYNYPKMVNGYVTTAEVTGDAAAIASTVGIETPITVSTVSSVPADVPQPKVVKLELRGEGASRVADVWVECTVDFLRYTVGSGASPSAEMATEATGAVAADGNAVQTVKITVPATDDSKFFRVIRK